MLDDDGTILNSSHRKVAISSTYRAGFSVRAVRSDRDDTWLPMWHCRILASFLHMVANLAIKFSLNGLRLVP